MRARLQEVSGRLRGAGESGIGAGIGGKGDEAMDDAARGRRRASRSRAGAEHARHRAPGARDGWTKPPCGVRRGRAPQARLLDPEYNLGNVLLAKGRPAQAVARFERVLQRVARRCGGVERSGERVRDAGAI